MITREPVVPLFVVQDRVTEARPLGDTCSAVAGAGSVAACVATSWMAFRSQRLLVAQQEI
jgi:hypothetical protein